MDEIRKEKYPSLFCDKKEIKELRVKYQKPLSQDDFFAFFTFRPLTIYISLFISKYTKITANQITIFMALLAFLSPLIIYVQTSIDMLFAVGFILYFFVYFLDFVDGEVARQRKTISKKGEIFDASLWFYLPLIHISYMMKLVTFLDLNNIIIILLLTVNFTSIYVWISQLLYTEDKHLNRTTKEQNIKAYLLNILKFIMSKSFIFLLAPLAYIFGLNQGMLHVYIYIAMFLYFMHDIKKMNKILKSV